MSRPDDSAVTGPSSGLQVQSDRGDAFQAQPPPDPGSETGFLSFLAKSAVWGAVTYFVAREFGAGQLWLVVLSVFLCSIPIALCGIYIATINQIRRLTLFAKRGWIFGLLSGRPLKVVLWVTWALVTSFFMLVQLHTYSNLEWILFFAVIPVFWVVFAVCRSIIAGELKTYVVTSMAITWSLRVCPLVMVALYVSLTLKFGQAPAYGSIEEAINAQRALVDDMTGSAVVREAGEYLALYSAARVYALGLVGNVDSALALLVVGVGSWVVFFNACTILACFAIPGGEFRRVFAPLSEIERPHALRASEIAAVSATTAFLVLFVYVPIFVSLEDWVRQSPGVSEPRKAAERSLKRLEKFDDDYYREGTFEELEKARNVALREAERSLAYLDQQTDLAFDRMESNVDGYLDWYYSLEAEYTRIAKLMVGEIEDYLTTTLENSLLQGDPFKKVQSAIDNAIATNEAAQRHYREAARRIMEQNRVDPGDSQIEVVRTASLKDVLNPPVHQDIIELKSRLTLMGGGALAAGATTRIVAKKVVGKVIGKNAVKLGAKALVKVTSTKVAGSVLGGAGVGAAGGAAIGSVVPLLGTAVGAAIGGIVGALAAGVAMDKGILMIEEAYGRDEFKGEILAAIREAKSEFKAGLTAR